MRQSTVASIAFALVLLGLHIGKAQTPAKPHQSTVFLQVILPAGN